MPLDFAAIRHLLIDLDGVLYRGNTVLSGAREFIFWLRSRNIRFRLVTNNATLTQEQFAIRLANMGIDVQAHEVFTSSMATALYVKREELADQTAYVIGEEGIRSALTGIGMSITDHNPAWVIVGLDRTLTYSKLASAALAIERGARFVGTNPDTSFPTEQGLIPGAGAILAALTATTGVQPTVVGKPRPLMLQLAMQQLDGSLTDTAMLGDRLDTDIQGAQLMGMPSVLVLTGVTQHDELTGNPIRPDLVVPDLHALMAGWGDTSNAD